MTLRIFYLISFSLALFSCSKPANTNSCNNCEISIFESITANPYYYNEDSFTKYHPTEDWCDYLNSINTTDTLKFYNTDGGQIASGRKICD